MRWRLVVYGCTAVLGNLCDEVTDLEAISSEDSPNFQAIVALPADTVTT